MNELPMYGRSPKGEKLRAADSVFMQTVTAQLGTPDSAVTLYTQMAWNYFNRGDRSTAMKRLNQVWLLDSNRAETYWGFALFSDAGDNPDYYRIIEYLEKAVVLAPKNALIAADLAFYYGLAPLRVRQMSDYEKAYLSAKSEPLFTRALGQEKNYQIYEKWAALLFLQKYYGSALEKVNLALELNPRDIPVQTLKAKIEKALVK
jgi:tetratricopeptide (TPR) repeat protein